MLAVVLPVYAEGAVFLAYSADEEGRVGVFNNTTLAYAMGAYFSSVTVPVIDWAPAAASMQHMAIIKVSLCFI